MLLLSRFWFLSASWPIVHVLFEFLESRWCCILLQNLAPQFPQQLIPVWCSARSRCKYLLDQQPMLPHCRCSPDCCTAQWGYHAKVSCFSLCENQRKKFWSVLCKAQETFCYGNKFNKWLQLVKSLGVFDPNIRLPNEATEIHLENAATSKVFRNCRPSRWVSMRISNFTNMKQICFLRKNATSSVKTSSFFWLLFIRA